ncbi:hypothetical protein GUITHDRAFT_117303 [Guillardia theta CCMP2712]|uniref:Uncharacterized protein n=1 Tax=Guillardia theta (strain CCMP2712) TaxID=905079 RepID=L1IJU7_GUITC|nr:hypothetical protein GUITHDRAFT_117303 [Guillardia theta CCMP2712]EKX36523.1 hypothetical protein GUITHDRAFT_117303 [Guillardia theta CCMP2712]|eukprot:XP_005823503.1 hypothetical protein GUITHDRAFT_117303 [Guillardia theta CCMP2712]
MCSQALCPQPLSHLQDNFEQLSVSSSTDDDPSESLIDQLSSPLASPRSKMSVDDTSAQDCGAPRRDQQRKGGRGPAGTIGPCRAKQLESLEHCIKLLSAENRPWIRSSTGEWMRL